ncbi:hypothetical protein [Lysobacter sp. TAB13]|uniref:hypothetical protein n=1 Tax=Lysobacter sp. TAB13 TaxID=3233065 RepID=UPI003F9D4AD1
MQQQQALYRGKGLSCGHFGDATRAIRVRLRRRSRDASPTPTSTSAGTRLHVDACVRSGETVPVRSHRASGDDACSTDAMTFASSHCAKLTQPGIGAMAAPTSRVGRFVFLDPATQRKHGKPHRAAMTRGMTLA